MPPEAAPFTDDEFAAMRGIWLRAGEARNDVYEIAFRRLFATLDRERAWRVDRGLPPAGVAAERLRVIRVLSALAEHEAAHDAPSAALALRRAAKLVESSEWPVVEVWSDAPQPEDEAIRAAFPTRTGEHGLYGEAMRLVSARHSKYALVALVNWLLSKVDGASKLLDRTAQNQEALLAKYDALTRECPHAVTLPTGDVSGQRWCCECGAISPLARDIEWALPRRARRGGQ
jgi:hypothetical protein